MTLDNNEKNLKITATTLNTIPVILCGGKGSRLSELTQTTNKPLIDIADIPIVLHVAMRYWLSGFKTIVLAAGWQFESFKTRFERKLEEAKQHPIFAPMAHNISFILLDTGAESDTFERIVQTCEFVSHPYYFITYGDTLTDIACKDILDQFNETSSARDCVLVSAVQPERRFSLIEFDEVSKQLTSFSEKSGRERDWVGCGFMIIPQKLIKSHSQMTSLEKAFLPEITSKSEAYVHPHIGLWHPIDYIIDVKKAQAVYDNEILYGTPRWLRA